MRQIKIGNISETVVERADFPPERLKAILGSDIGHFDVKDMDEVLEESWELVEHGALGEEELRDLTFTNPVSLFGGMNPDFFKGTVVESQAATEMAGK